MKISTITLNVFILIFLTAYVGLAQQQFTHTVTSTNRYCNNVCSLFDVSGLNNKPGAVVFVTPGAANYTHPIGAYYVNTGRWSVFNLDNSPIAVGATFNVEYYASPDTSHFIYVAPPLVHSNDARFIDHAGMNNNPNAQVRVFPTNSPPAGVNGATFNSTEVRVDYDLTTAKWFIYNVISPPAPVPAGTAYSVKFTNNTPLPISTPSPTAVPMPTPTPGTPGTLYLPPLTLAPPASAVPIGPAGGDLSGTYPNPKVIGLQGRPVSTTVPTVGQTLRWNGTAWTPTTDPAAATVLPKSYYGFLTPDFTWAGGSGYEIALPGMSIQITITTPSIVNISVYSQTEVHTDCGVINNCGGQATGINLYRNNILLVKTLRGGANDSVTQILPNYPELLGPGTYTYKVLGRRIYSNSSIKYLGASNPDESFKSYMSLQVFPQ